MPALVFIPLPGIASTVAPEHLHGAMCEWLDTAGDWGHKSVSKPYSVSPVTIVGGMLGVQVGTLTDVASRALLAGADGRSTIRLGRKPTRVGLPVTLHAKPWKALATTYSRRWRVEFLSPTTFRTGDRTSPFPSPERVLRAVRQTWDEFSPIDLEAVVGAEHDDIWVSDLDIESTSVTLRIGQRGGDGRRELRAVNAVMGTVTYRCDTAAVAAKIAPLFALAPYCGVGSFRGKGMGVVNVMV